MIIKLNLYNESLRDKMTPKSMEEIVKNLPSDMGEIYHKSKELGWKIEINGYGINTYLILEFKYFRITIMRHVKRLFANITIWISPLATTYNIPDLSGIITNFEQLKSKIDELLNIGILHESLRDKMTPKSSEDIKSILKNKKPNEIFQIGVKLGDVEIVKTAFEKDMNINILYPELTSIVVGDKLDIVKTILEYEPESIYKIVKAVIENMVFSNRYTMNKNKLESYIGLSNIPRQKILDKSLIYQCHINGGNGIKLLYEMGADIHQDNEEPLMQSVYNGRDHSVRALLSLGADPTINGNRPLEEAKRRKYMDIADIIKSHISNLPIRKRLSRYLPFLKESLRDKMTPKSKEDIKNTLDGLNPENKILKIISLKILDYYSKEEIKDILYKLDDETKVKTILKYQLLDYYSNSELRDLLDKMGNDFSIILQNDKFINLLSIEKFNELKERLVTVLIEYYSKYRKCASFYKNTSWGNYSIGNESREINDMKNRLTRYGNGIYVVLDKYDFDELKLYITKKNVAFAEISSTEYKIWSHDKIRIVLDKLVGDVLNGRKEKFTVIKFDDLMR